MLLYISFVNSIFIPIELGTFWPRSINKCTRETVQRVCFYKHCDRFLFCLHVLSGAVDT